MEKIRSSWRVCVCVCVCPASAAAGRPGTRFSPLWGHSLSANRIISDLIRESAIVGSA